MQHGSSAAASSIAAAAAPVVPAAAGSASASGASSALGLIGLGAGGELLVDRTRHPSGIVPTLQNIVATVNLGCPLNLKDIAMRARNAEYNPKRFSAVIMRIREPKTTALIFHSGKVVVTGARTEEQSRLAARKYARIVQKLGNPSVQFSEFRVQNMVGSADVRFPIRLEGLANEHEDYSSYEPELFPGLIYRMVEPKIVMLIFVSGKVVLTGAKTREQIYDAFEHIYPVLADFRKEVTHHQSAIPPLPTLATPKGKKGRAAIKQQQQ